MQVYVFMHVCMRIINSIFNFSRKRLIRYSKKNFFFNIQILLDLEKRNSINKYKDNKIEQKSCKKKIIKKEEQEKKVDKRD